MGASLSVYWFTMQRRCVVFGKPKSVSNFLMKVFGVYYSWSTIPVLGKQKCVYCRVACSTMYGTVCNFSRKLLFKYSFSVPSECLLLHARAEPHQPEPPHRATCTPTAAAAAATAAATAAAAAALAAAESVQASAAISRYTGYYVLPSTSRNLEHLKFIQFCKQTSRLNQVLFPYTHVIDAYARIGRLLRYGGRPQRPSITSTDFW